MITARVFADTAAVSWRTAPRSQSHAGFARLDRREHRPKPCGTPPGHAVQWTLSRVRPKRPIVSSTCGPLSILTEASMLKIGEALDAEQVVYGSFEFTGGPGGRSRHRGGSAAKSPRVFSTAAVSKQSSEFIESGNLEGPAYARSASGVARADAAGAPTGAAGSGFPQPAAGGSAGCGREYVRGLLARTPEQQERFFLQAAQSGRTIRSPDYQLGRMHYDRKEYRQAADWLQKITPETHITARPRFCWGWHCSSPAILRDPRRRSRRWPMWCHSAKCLTI